MNVTPLSIEVEIPSSGLNAKEGLQKAEERNYPQKGLDQLRKDYRPKAKANEKAPHKERLCLGAEVGYAWFFEHTVIYGPFLNVLAVFGKKSKNRILSKHGAFIGVVKGLIPVDPFYVLYEYHHHTKAFLERQKFRVWKRKRGITRLQLQNNRKLKEF